MTADSEQWSSFTTTAQMFEACQVPENIAEDMSAEALLQTVIDYPILAQSDQKARYNMLFEYNAAFRELIKRQDAKDVIAQQCQTMSGLDPNSATDEQIVKLGGLEMLYDLIDYQ